MASWRVLVVSLAVLCTALYGLEVGAAPTCATSCARQYQANVKHCKDTLASNPGKGAWYADCMKYAETFRNECLRHCR